MGIRSKWAAMAAWSEISDRILSAPLNQFLDVVGTDFVILAGCKVLRAQVARSGSMDPPRSVWSFVAIDDVSLWVGAYPIQITSLVILKDFHLRLTSLL